MRMDVQSSSNEVRRTTTPDSQTAIRQLQAKKRNKSSSAETEQSKKFRDWIESVSD